MDSGPRLVVGSQVADKKIVLTKQNRVWQNKPCKEQKIVNIPKSYTMLPCVKYAMVH